MSIDMGELYFGTEGVRPPEEIKAIYVDGEHQPEHYGQLSLLSQQVELRLVGDTVGV
jgi:hypothetical protein